ncbi:Rieske (2Fe-2S) protein [Cellulomonas sp. DKR-3]|uniref:Cytochrome bc1 complex Rieske iron-sulfur subunit n=1 Tax=Cellulomonas fulva TaxID=2835530 RepID=A0ABS5TWU5_9CELL|nr:Rieske (2Fe-2S) protein [Cellulomonas fulva]MBT0993629.1 Rieske (2Fe-2S) protein [Cellulomonas fulva]
MTDLTSTTEKVEHHACGGCLDRRQLLTRAGGAGLAVAGVAVLAACGSSDSPGTGSGGTGGSAGTDGSDAQALAQVADIPVGGALAATDAGGNKILLVQATEGTVTAYSAVCTHQGCEVQPDDGELHCPCHNSVFGLDGSNVSGPADEPLPAVEVHVQDGAVYAGAA